MSSKRVIANALAVMFTASVWPATVHGQICQPAPDGSGGCVPIACSDIPEEQCLATVLHLDVATGAISAIACDCIDFNRCHIEFGNASPHAAGFCPDGQPCVVAAWDTDGDGLDDHFAAECVPSGFGACCMDIDDGPVGLDTCMETDEISCKGYFVPVNTGCSEIEACCLTFAGESFCADLNHHCCILTGGIPLGPGSACAVDPSQNPCSQICGGFAGIPCENPNEFCRYPIGTCQWADHFGMCTPIPGGCPDIWEPVCGCDGVTYANECEANAASMSIDHYGACGLPCMSDADCDDGNACTIGLCVNGVCEYVFAPDGTLCDDGNPCTAGDVCKAGVCVGTPIPECGPCMSNADCPAADPFCLFPPGSCGEDGIPGMCVPRPTDCPDVWDPVCGCDGQTYSNECDAHAAGVSVRHPGECVRYCGHMGPDPQCYPNEFCKYPVGTCGNNATVLGICTPIPGDCITLWDPVCGCDGVTYSNECFADMAAVSILHYGECLPGDVGACCIRDPAGEFACLEVTQGECLAKGGTHIGIGTTCPADPAELCAPYFWACCMPDGDCFDTWADYCIAVGGVPVPGAPCALVNCGPQCTSDADCDDGNTCTIGLCNNGLCEYEPLLDGTVCDDGNPCTAEDVCTAGVCVGIPIPGCGECMSNADCPAADLFCLFPPGTCGEDGIPGTCVPRPSVCPDVWDPVCGCDGQTYGNECDAHAAGVSIRHHGECGLVECRPTDDGMGCVDAPCDSAIPEVQCISTLVRIDSPGTQPLVAVCECLDFNICHVELIGGVPVPVGFCPDGNTCELVGLDLDGDGIDDHLMAQCGSDEIGACCFDISGGPLPLPHCIEAPQRDCEEKGGIFAGVGTRCELMEACCMTWGGVSYCVETNPICCAAFGGVPQGPGTACTDVTCGEVCGGIAGIPCDDPNEFCKYPTGTCGEGDIFGTCTVIPSGCPDVWDPVCGCDGMTYGNECEADAAGVSIAYWGECTPIFCWSNDMCEPDQYCFFHDCAAETGVCMPRPEVCPDVWDPVCGCDGVTYPNACEAARAGMSVDYPGECRRICFRDDPAVACFPDEFCKFPPGTCEDLTVPGACTPIPEACPEVYDPVCGCDGITYDNECFADMAAESIAYFGECQECAARRDLAVPDLTYCPGVPKHIQIHLSPRSGVTAYALEDRPPAGWEVTFVSGDGFYDELNGKVKWGPFFPDTLPRSVSYVAVPPLDFDAVACFEGAISLDGINEPICGDACIEPHCAPFMAADTPQPPCPQCPVGDCTTCPAPAPTGACRDWRISLCELVGYACAWLRGCNDDLAGLTRAAYIWRHGECYCWHEVQQNWFPTDCPPPSSGICGSANLGPGDVDPSESGGAVAYLRFSRLDGRHSRAKEVKVVIVTEAPDVASAMALDFTLPTGWEPVTISDDGKWDETHRKVKWGPFYDDLTRRITLQARSTAASTIRPTRISSGEPVVGRFSGTISFDGHNEPIVVKR